MSNSLFILEGSRDEPKLLNSLFREMKKSDQQKCFFFHSNLHALANILLPDDEDELDGIDLLLAIKGNSRGNAEAEVLNLRYTDIFLVFDFEPQEDSPVFNKIRKMVSFFNDSTNNGKLYINYPMMQSYRHLIALPDPSFEYRKAVYDSTKSYKQLVEEEATAIPSGIQSYDHVLLYSLAVHHLKKREKLLGRRYALPDDYDESEDEKVFDFQCSMLKENQCCYVLNTSILLLVAYAPRQFILEVKTHAVNYDI